MTADEVRRLTVLERDNASLNKIVSD